MFTGISAGIRLLDASLLVRTQFYPNDWSINPSSSKLMPNESTTPIDTIETNDATLYILIIVLIFLISGVGIAVFLFMRSRDYAWTEFDSMDQENNLESPPSDVMMNLIPDPPGHLKQLTTQENISEPNKLHPEKEMTTVRSPACKAKPLGSKPRSTITKLRSSIAASKARVTLVPSKTSHAAPFGTVKSFTRLKSASKIELVSTGFMSNVYSAKSGRSYRCPRLSKLNQT